MGDAARRTRTAPDERPAAVPAPMRHAERPTPRRVPDGMVRVRGVICTRSGYVVRTYDVPAGLLDDALIHERVPDTLATATDAIGADLWLEAQ